MTKISSLLVKDFLDLGDVPLTYIGQAGKVVTVNPGENGLIFSAVVPPATPTLSQVLTAGNDATNQDIINLDSISTTVGALNVALAIDSAAEFIAFHATRTGGLGGNIDFTGDISVDGLPTLKSYLGVLSGKTTQFNMAMDKIDAIGTTAGFSGINYGADYSASYTNRSLVDKAYVLSVLPSTPTLASVLGAGRNVDATGTIKTSGGIFSIDVNNNSLYSNVLMTSTLDWGNALLSNGSGYTLDWNARTVNQGKWDYDADYSAGFVARSLIDKGYAQATFAPISVVGSVTSVSVVTNQGVSGTVATATTTPAITLTLGALTGVTSYNGLVVTANTGIITTGTWNATAIPLAYGGTNANLTASNGGIFYSTATAGAILAGTATANQLLISGASGAPSWYVPTTGRIPYFTTSGAVTSDATLLYDGTNGQFGNAATSTFSIGTTNPTTNAVNHFFVGGNFVMIGQNVANGEAEFGLNYYYNSGFKYRFSDGGGANASRAGRLVWSQSSLLARAGDLDFETAPTSTGAGNAITWTTRMTLKNSGELIIGATSLISSELLSLQKSSNGITQMVVKNATSGTAALSRVVVVDSTNNGMQITAVSGLYTSSGIVVASTGLLNSSQSGGLNLGTDQNAQVSIWTNNIKRYSISATGINTWFNSIELPYVAKTANYTATTTDYTIDCTSNTFTITLPTAVGCAGRIYVIKNSGLTGGVITVDANASETIDGALTQTLSYPDSMMIQSNNVGWIII